MRTIWKKKPNEKFYEIKTLYAIFLFTKMQNPVKVIF